MTDPKILLSIRLRPEAKKTLKEKAKTLHMTASQYVENRVLSEPEQQITMSYESPQAHLENLIKEVINRLNTPWYKRIFN